MHLDDVLALLDHRTRLLALTEPLHGQQHVPLLRNALLAALVDRAGYRSVAVESCCLRGARLDALLARGVEPDDARRDAGFSHGWGPGRGNRELVAWIAAHNRAAAPRDRVRFSGFDAPLESSGADSPRDALEQVHGFLQARGATALPAWDRIADLLGPDAPWSDPAVIRDPARGRGATPAAAELTVVAGELAWRHATTAPDGPDDDAWWDAAAAARSATGLLAYHRLLVLDDAYRVQRLAAQRDAMMAANLAAVVERERGRGPTLVFAHHGHLQRGPSAMTMGVELVWNGAGALLGPRLGPELTVLGTLVGAAPERGIGAPEPGTVERVLLDAHPGGAVLRSAEARRLAAGAGTRAPAPPPVGYSGADDALLAGLDLVWLLPELTA
ncbi:erythromycin esterase family protein [Pseudonocardia broussonetiae]|uniref:Erythromycin esterase family protein n=1 Tax=Pseudonocardia broussonetiae TaxID=2736640 RepID=A0A6M6JEA4_9PSEU|nr:erythromycin esterase family protein [Pseudonocardia broussonetiae]QJY45162.1 erythromycin esterase family protein [Pseudonocardia broussonetiae]